MSFLHYRDVYLSETERCVICNKYCNFGSIHGESSEIEMAVVVAGLTHEYSAAVFDAHPPSDTSRRLAAAADLLNALKED